MLKSLLLENYRCFEKSKIDYKDITVIVGKNNAGKSTMIEALRMVAYASRKSVQAIYKDIPYGFEISAREKGIRIDADTLKIDLRGIVYLYEDKIASITATFTDGCKIIILANAEQAFARLYTPEGKNIKIKSKAAEYQFNSIGILPQIGLIKEVEKLLEKSTVENHKDTYLSSRHFRNEILMYREETWGIFKKMAEESWDNLQLTEINYNIANSEFIQIMVSDSRFLAEIGLMGSGLQMWLQIIWFICRSNSKKTIILDEPDVYMHPDLQQKLIRLVTAKFPQVIIATHSIEIISEVSPSNIIMVDKTSRQMKYANSSHAVQSIIDNIGGVQNISLIRIGLKKKCLFVEGKDMKIISKIFDKIYPSSNNDLSTLPTIQLNGFSNLREAYGAANLFYNETHGGIKCICILDRDYYPEEYLKEILIKSEENHLDLYVWKRKEIENYLIIPKAIYRLTKEPMENYHKFIEKFNEILDAKKEYITDQFSEKLHKYSTELAESTCNYRTQKIKHFPINHKEVILILRKRRYVCTCGKRFYEEYSFLTKYMRTSKELLKYVCNEIRKQVSFSTVAMNCRLSLSTTIRYFNHINYPTEGFNNKIKVLKRISYGFRNFERFRNRILHCD